MATNKRILISLIKRDIIYGYKKSRRRYFVLILIITLINIAFISRVNSIKYEGIGGIVFDMFKGVSYHISLSIFEIPTIWILVNAFVIFIIGGYLYDDLDKNGIYLIMRGGKLNFWVSKFIWIVLNVLIYYLCITLITLMIVKIYGIKIDTNYLNVNLDKWQLLLYGVSLYVTTSIMLSSLYVFMITFIKSEYAYLVIISILISSLFIKSNLMPGQHSLILRHFPFDTDFGLTLIKSLLYNFIVTIGSLVGSYRVISKKDII